jgi:hypothetical protein
MPPSCVSPYFGAIRYRTPAVAISRNSTWNRVSQQLVYALIRREIDGLPERGRSLPLRVAENKKLNAYPFVFTHIFVKNRIRLDDDPLPTRTLDPEPFTVRHDRFCARCASQQFTLRRNITVLCAFYPAT